MERKLSIIVPVYNAEKYLDRCVDSLLNQTYKNLEVILVNDGSKDNSLSICKAFAEKDDRVIVFDKENGGAASARNLGIKNASGYYIGFCDSDDFFDLDAFKTLIGVMEENNLPTIECLAKVYSEDLVLLESAEESKDLVSFSSSDAIREIFLRRGSVHLATRITKKEFITDLDIPEGKRVEDFYFTILLLTKTMGTTVYKYPLYNYVICDGSVTHSKGGSIYIEALYFYEKAVSYLKDFNFDIESACEYYLFKMYYLLSISLNSAERKKYKTEIRAYKKQLRISKKKIKSQPNLTKKEKLILAIASKSFRLARLLYLVKNIL